MRIARLQTWSVTGATRSVFTQLGCMKVMSSGFIGVAVLLMFLHLQRSDSGATSFFPTMRAEGAYKGVISQHFILQMRKSDSIPYYSGL